MTTEIASHYAGKGALADRIAAGLRSGGVEPTDLRPADLESIDEFHFRGREATLELLAQMELAPQSMVLDIGSGLGGVARTIAEIAGCHVTGIDLTRDFCDAATVMSGWVDLADKTEFIQGDATSLPFSDAQFDAAITVHVAMNIAQKDRLYKEARRVLRPGGIFAVYDILQGDGGEMIYPAPWASEPAISYLATPGEMETLLSEAEFRILETRESTRESLCWLEERAARAGPANAIPVTTQLLFGEGFRDMVANQLIALKQRRILTYTFICRA